MIFFIDPAEKPVELVHMLKLYSDQNAQPSVKKPVISEKYDEIVFFEPTENFAYILDKGPKALDQAAIEEMKQQDATMQNEVEFQISNQQPNQNNEDSFKEGGGSNAQQ